MGCFDSLRAVEEMAHEAHLSGSRPAGGELRPANRRPGHRSARRRPLRALRPGRLLPLVLLAVYTLLFALWVHTVPNRGLFNVVSNLGGLVGGAVASALVWATVLDPRLPPQLRRSWRWLSASLTVFWLGDAAFLVSKIALRGGVVGTSPADALYLASYPLAAMALLTAGGWRPEREERAAFWLDATMVTLGGATLAWHVFVQPTFAGHHETEALTAVAYVLCDVALLMLLAIGALRRGALPAGILLLGAALLVRLCANGLYWFDVLLGPPGWIGLSASVAYNVAWLSFALAACVQVRDARRRRGRAWIPAVQTSAVTWLPTVAAAVGYLVLAGSVVRRSSFELGFLLFAGVGLTAAVLARQLVAVREAGRVSAERTARANEARFRSLVENASDIVLVIGARGEVRYHTPSAERFLGHEATWLRGLALADVVHPEDRALVAALLADAVRRPGSTPSAEWRLRWADRSWRFVEGKAKSVPEDPHLGGVILTLRSVHERKQLEERLAHQAFHDPLTNLANRVLLSERLEHALARSRRAGERVTVLFVDLDDFKNVNDTLGHATGDQILVELSRRLASCVRSGETTARLGGDEFAVLVEEGGVPAALQVANRIDEAVRQPFPAAGRDIVLGASIGIASSERGSAAGDLLRNADIAMYRAKEQGKGRVVVFETGMQVAVHQRLELEEELRGALQRGELELVYQPVVELASGLTVGAEVLLRWNHRTRGLLCPVDFVEAAEAAGVMPAIGRWTVASACATARVWPALAGESVLPIVCINVAPRLLASAEFVGGVEQAVAATGLPPGRLVLEVTEGAAVEDAPAFAAMRALRARGVRIAIDDFGTGYSSLSYLRDMPADILKLDKLFVDSVADDPQARKLTRGILDLARALGKLVVAEGIEQEEQAARLRELGCTFGQGFLFSPAVSAGDVLRLLEQASGARELPYVQPVSVREKGGRS